MGFSRGIEFGPATSGSQTVNTDDGKTWPETSEFLLGTMERQPPPITLTWSRPLLCPRISHMKMDVVERIKQRYESLLTGLV